MDPAKTGPPVSPASSHGENAGEDVAGASAGCPGGGALPIVAGVVAGGALRVGVVTGLPGAPLSGLAAVGRAGAAAPVLRSRRSGAAGDLPAGSPRGEELRGLAWSVGMVRAAGLGGVSGRVEDLGVAARVAQCPLGDPGQGVPALDDVRRQLRV